VALLSASPALAEAAEHHPLSFAACAHTPPSPRLARRSLIGCCVRGEIRAKYNIPGDAVSDCCTHYWCGPCATCQEYEELTTRITAAKSRHG